MFLEWPYTNIFQIIPIWWKTWPPGGGACFPYMLYSENLKKSSCTKLLSWFENNLAHMFLTFCQGCSIYYDPLKNMATRRVACFSYMYRNFEIYWSSIKSVEQYRAIMSLSLDQLSLIKARGDLFWSLWPSSARYPSLNFSFQHHLLLNHRTNLNQTSQECSFGGPHQRGQNVQTLNIFSSESAVKIPI